MNNFRTWLEDEYVWNSELVQSLRDLLIAQQHLGTHDQFGARVNYNELSAFNAVKQAYQSALQRDTLVNPEEINKLFNAQLRNPQEDAAFVAQIKKAIQVASQEYTGPRYKRTKWDDDDE